MSQRSAQPFHAVGCATLQPEELAALITDEKVRSVHGTVFLRELAESEERGQRVFIVEPQRNIALTYVSEDRAVALEWAERALASARASGVSTQEPLALQTLGIVRTARGEVGEAIAALEQMAIHEGFEQNKVPSCRYA